MVYYTSFIFLQNMDPGSIYKYKFVSVSALIGFLSRWTPMALCVGWSDIYLVFNVGKYTKNMKVTPKLCLTNENKIMFLQGKIIMNDKNQIDWKTNQREFLNGLITINWN